MSLTSSVVFFDFREFNRLLHGGLAITIVLFRHFLITGQNILIHGFFFFFGGGGVGSSMCFLKVRWCPSKLSLCTSYQSFIVLFSVWK